MLHVIHNIQRVPTGLTKEYKKLSSATVHEASGGIGALSANIKPISTGQNQNAGAEVANKMIMMAKGGLK